MLMPCSSNTNMNLHRSPTAEFYPLALDYFRVNDDKAVREQLLGDPNVLEQIRKLLKINSEPVWVIVS
jgi:hypothetical protein